MTTADAPPAGTRERWAFELVTTPRLDDKLRPPPLPAAWEPDAPPRRWARPGRAEGLVVGSRSEKAPRPGSLARPEQRARLLHVFLHHEVQAAELFAWALLAFPDAPAAFRAGLLGLLAEELAHARLYEARLAALGSRYGAFPVRDWFWERIPRCESAASFVATLGVGFEGGNLDHAGRFEAALRAAGDDASADAVATVATDEEGHVRFAADWFQRLTGAPLTFEAWRAALPAPLGPLLMRGGAVARDARLRAGLPAPFVDALEAVDVAAAQRPRAG